MPGHGPRRPPPEPAGGLLTIGEFARRSRLSAKALRLYDRLGLLPPAEVDPHSGYRRYRTEQLATARLVVLLRRLDMPLARVAEIVAAPDERAAGLLDAYWVEVEARFAGQRQLTAYLRDRLSGGTGPARRYDIRERDVPEQRVLTEQRHVHVPDLADWIGAATMRLVGTAGRYGGVSGPMFVIYHGEVNEESDGPVEICLPVDPPPGTRIDAASRTEPAHREVYLRVSKDQVAYPQILSAFEAVADWIGRHARTVGAAPREIYFADFAAAGPTDEVCDVAFPVTSPGVPLAGVAATAGVPAAGAG